MRIGFRMRIKISTYCLGYERRHVFLFQTVAPRIGRRRRAKNRDGDGSECRPSDRPLLKSQVRMDQWVRVIREPRGMIGTRRLIRRNQTLPRTLRQNFRRDPKLWDEIRESGLIINKCLEKRYRAKLEDMAKRRLDEAGRTQTSWLGSALPAHRGTPSR